MISPSQEAEEGVGAGTGSLSRHTFETSQFRSIYSQLEVPATESLWDTKGSSLPAVLENLQNDSAVCVDLRPGLPGGHKRRCL